MDEIDKLLADYDPNAKSKTYAQLADEYPNKAGLKLLASREAEKLSQPTESLRLHSKQNTSTRLH